MAVQEFSRGLSNYFLQFFYKVKTGRGGFGEESIVSEAVDTQCRELRLCADRGLICGKSCFLSRSSVSSR
jgi:hypothetical protein